MKKHGRNRRYDENNSKIHVPESYLQNYFVACINIFFLKKKWKISIDFKKHQEDVIILVPLFRKSL